MIQIVNETKHLMHLVMHENLLVIEGEKESNMKVCSVYPISAKDVAEKLDKESKGSGKIEILPNRTTKFCPISRKGYLTMYQKTNGSVTVLTKKIGDTDDSAYHYPKGLIVIITDSVTTTTIAGKEETMLLGASVEPTNSKMVHPVSNAVLYGKCPTEDTPEGERVLVQSYACDTHKWGKITPATYITLPNEDHEKLRLGEITFETTEGQSKTINALIRCDKKGTEIPRSPKKKRNPKKK